VVIVLVLSLDYSIACSGSEFSCSTPTTFQDRRSDKSKLTIASFNAEWMYWDNENNGPSTRCPLDHSAGTCRWEDKTQLDNHLQVVAVMLVNINADIITLEEVLDCRVLQCLIDAMGDSSYKPYLVPGRDTGTDQNVAIISRVDPIIALTRDEQRATIYRSDSSCGNLPNPSYESGVSKHFIARFNIPGLGPISLIGVHFLALPTTPDRCIRREAQATVIKNIAQNERNAGREVVILGDLNDYDRDILDASNSAPTSRVSDFLKWNGNTQIMHSALEKISNRDTRYSSWWDKNSDCIVQSGELTLIDHILLSPVLFQRVLTVQVYNNIVEECDSLNSDHYPIKVVLDTPALETEGDLNVQSAQIPNEEQHLSPTPMWTTTTIALTVSFIVLALLIVGIIVFFLKKKQKAVLPS